MRLYLIILLQCVALSKIIAQGFRSQFYLPGDSNNVSRAIFEIIPDKYSVNNPVKYFAAGSSDRLTVMGLDSLGKPLWVKKYGNSQFTYISNVFVRRSFYKQGNFIYHACCVRDGNNNQIGALLKFNFDGDTLWQKIYRDSIEDVIPQMVTASVDGGFLITGFFQNWVNHTRPGLLIKTDAHGNELWRKRLHKTNPNVSDGKCIVQDSSSKKIIIGGFKYFPVTQIYDNVLILDSLGNNAVSANYGRAGSIVEDLIQTQDKKIIMVGHDYDGQTLGGDNLMESYAVKIDIHNPQKPIWKIIVDKPTHTNLFTSVRELKNGNILIGGVIDTLQILNILPINLIRLTEIKPNGEIVKKHYYNYKRNNDTTKDYLLRLSCLELTNDGLCVVSIETINKPYFPFFFVKYDASGCDSTLDYCKVAYAIDTTVVITETVGINKLKIKDYGLKIYPNPVSEILNVECEILNDKTELSIIDLYGREVKRVKLTNDKQINVSELSAGIYFLQVFEKEKLLTTQKIMKE